MKNSGKIRYFPLDLGVFWKKKLKKIKTELKNLNKKLYEDIFHNKNITNIFICFPKTFNESNQEDLDLKIPLFGRDLLFEIFSTKTTNFSSNPENQNIIFEKNKLYFNPFLNQNFRPPLHILLITPNEQNIQYEDFNIYKFLLDKNIKYKKSQEKRDEEIMKNIKIKKEKMEVKEEETKKRDLEEKEEEQKMEVEEEETEKMEFEEEETEKMELDEEEEIEKMELDEEEETEKMEVEEEEIEKMELDEEEEIEKMEVEEEEIEKMELDEEEEKKMQVDEEEETEKMELDEEEETEKMELDEEEEKKWREEIRYFQ